MAGEKAGFLAALRDDKVCVADISRLAGVSRATVYRWREEVSLEAVAREGASCARIRDDAGFIPVKLAEAAPLPRMMVKEPSLCPSEPLSPPTPQAVVPPASINVAFGPNLNLSIVGVPELSLLEHVMTILSRVATSR
ncbi:MAG: helix-turn-helix domain-containing protein [Hyphomicrobiales bacterium]|nr:helix-turn-helix domain-containing protein [Hyphomicrobiales bacterium]MDE2114292.1 helix-turn-helix domain-containing protein [Hyphomicrobiales bacterium]